MFKKQSRQIIVYLVMQSLLLSGVSHAADISCLAPALIIPGDTAFQGAINKMMDLQERPFEKWTQTQEPQLQKITQQIIKQPGYKTFKRDSNQYNYGHREMPVEIWCWQDENKVDLKGEKEFYPQVFYFRVGNVLYLHTDAYAQLSRSLKQRIKNRVIILNNVRDKRDGGRFQDEVLPGCGIMPHDEVFTLLSLIQIINSDFKNITRAIDFGAGDGIRALTALRLGLVSNVDLVSIDLDDLLEASQRMRLNGFSEKNGDFKTHHTYIQDTVSVIEMFEAYKNEKLAVFSNLGYWIEKEKWGIDNQDVIGLIRGRENVKLFVAGGSWMPRYSHRAKVDNNKILFKNTDFAIVEKQAGTKHKDSSPLFSWSAQRQEKNTGQQLEDILTHGDNTEIDKALKVLGERQDTRLVHSILDNALRRKGFQVALKEDGEALLVQIMDRKENIIGGMTVFPESDSVEGNKLYFQNIGMNQSQEIGKRIFPLVLRWLDTNPLFVDQFSGWQIEVVPANEGTYKSWMRSYAFLSTGKRYKHYKGGFYSLYGKVAAAQGKSQPTRSGRDFLLQLSRHGIAHGKILGLASGSGEDELYAAENGYDVTATDVNPAKINEILEKAKQRSIVLEAKELDLSMDIPKSNKTYDAIYVRLGLHYYSKTEVKRIINQLQMLLNDNGIIYGVVKSTDDFYYNEYAKGNRIRADGMVFIEDPNTQETYWRSFFNADDIHELFADFQMLDLQHYQERLYSDSHDSSLISFAVQKTELNTKKQIKTTARLLIKQKKVGKASSGNTAAAREVKVMHEGEDFLLHERNAITAQALNLQIAFEYNGAYERIELPELIQRRLLENLQHSQADGGNCFDFLCRMNGFAKDTRESDLPFISVQEAEDLHPGDSVRIGKSDEGKMLAYQFALYLGHGLFIGKMDSGGVVLVHDWESLKGLYRQDLALEKVDTKKIFLADENKFRNLLKQEMPQIIPQKHAHINAVIRFMDLFMQGDFDGLYNTFLQAADVDKDEYIMLAKELFARYQGLSPQAKHALAAATIFHDIGSRSGERDWEHNQIGRDLVTKILQTHGYDKYFIEEVAALVYNHGFYWNVGLDFLPRDYAALSKEQRNAVLLLQFFDNSGRAGGNILFPWKIRLLLQLRDKKVEQFLEEDNLYVYRFENNLSPVLFADPQQRDKDLRDAHTLLAQAKYQNAEFKYDWNERIRNYVFGIFQLLGKDSLQDTFLLVDRIMDAYRSWEQKNAKAKDIIIDTDIDFMALAMSDRTKYINKLQALLHNNNDVPILIRADDDSLRVIIQLHKALEIPVEKTAGALRSDRAVKEPRIIEQSI